MQELQRNQLQYVDSASFLRDQLLMYLPCLLIWITGLGWLWFHQAGKPYRFIAWAYVALILLLLLEHGKGYYSMGAYPPLFAFGALRLEAWMWQRRLFLRYVLLGHMILLGYFSVPLLLPFLPPPQLADYYARHRTAKLGLLKWEDGENHSLPQDFADMLSWKEMTAKTAHAYSLLDDAEKSHTLLFCDNYGQAGALNYYGPRYHLPAAYSDNASFLYWLPADFFRFDNILLLTDDRQELKHPFIHEFRQAILVDSVSNPYAREYGSFIILLKGPDSIFRKEFVEKIQEDLRKTAPRSR